MAPLVAEHTRDIDGLPVAWRSAPLESDGPARLYVHGVPNSSLMWDPFLARGGGIALDLPGFGRSVKIAGFDYSIEGYARFLERFADELELDTFSLVVHDWGAAALAFAQRRPEQLERLVIADAVPLLPGYRWHRIARVWRTPLLGELAMGITTPGALRRISKIDSPGGVPLDDAQLEQITRYFDHGTQRAILKLYRASPPQTLAAGGVGLGDLKAPALIVWGERDPYLPSRFAHEYAAALGGSSRVEVVPGAGHWPWAERPELIAEITGFLAE